jgi:hypothetical protein
VHSNYWASNEQLGVDGALVPLGWAGYASNDLALLTPELRSSQLASQVEVIFHGN